MGKKKRRNSPRKSRGSQAATGGGRYGSALDIDALSRGHREIPQQEPSVIITDSARNVPPGAGLVIEDPDPGDDGGRLRITHGREEGPLTRQVLEEMGPPGPAPEPRVVAPKPRQLLALHAGMAARYANPDPELAGSYDTLISQQQGEYWYGMFSTARDGRDWCGLVARMLSRARTYQVTADMSERVTAACQASSEDYTVEPAELPWPAGFAWADRPVACLDDWDRPGCFRVLTWGPDGPGIRVVTWNWHADGKLSRDPDLATWVGRMGGLTMTGSAGFAFGATVHGTQRPGQVGVIRWARTLWHFLSAEIAVSASVPVEAHARRRALRSLKHGEVHVITLRRKRPVTGETDPQAHRHVQWKCRWPVQGFWRHPRRSPDYPLHHAVPGPDREHCAECGMKVSWIGAFTKGPAGAPWKQDRALYRLSR